MSEHHAWSLKPLSERLEWVAAFRRAVASYERDLCALMEQEVGKSRLEALTSDIAPVLAACKHVEQNAKRLFRPRALGRAPFWLGKMRVRVHREPLGDIAIIATWNYPVGLLGVQLVQALAAGNCVTVKPSERAPRTQALLLGLAQASGLPAGALRWTHPNREAGEQLLFSRRFDHVVFTGSTVIGRDIASILAPNMTGLTLELSGRDSAFVLGDADPKHAAACLWAGLCLNAGQTCMGPRRALVHRSVYQAFCAEITALATNAATRRMIDQNAAMRCYTLATQAVAQGARDAASHARGGPSAQTPIPAPVDGFWRPTVLLDCPGDHDVVKGDHFGPLLAVVPVDTLDQALLIHDACDQHLTASIFTKDVQGAKLLAHSLHATNITINDLIVPTAHPDVSIGGRGESGIGVTRGDEGLLSMTRPVYVSVSKGLIRRAAMKPGRLVLGTLAQLIRWRYGGSDSLRDALSGVLPGAQPLIGADERRIPGGASSEKMTA